MPIKREWYSNVWLEVTPDGSVELFSVGAYDGREMAGTRSVFWKAGTESGLAANSTVEERWRRLEDAIQLLDAMI